MRVAALYDIHGNIDALEAVLDEIERESIDRVLIGGDLAWGPFPAEVLDRVRSFALPCVRGNADREVAGLDDQGNEQGDWVGEVTAWCAQQLDGDQRRFLRDLPETQSMAIEGVGDVLFCHATPRSDEEIITAITPEDEIATILRDVKQEVIVCGHTHSQFDRAIDDRRLVNAGSVGLPYEDDPGAYWALVGPDLTLRRTEYDFERAARRIRESGCPAAEWFADGITSPLSRSEAIAIFEGRRSQS